jgi:hypothetical protein
MAKLNVDRKELLNLSVTVGHGFYGGKRHDTNEEIATALNSHAAHSTGVLKEVFQILESYYRSQVGLPLHQLVETPDPNIAGGKGGHSGGINITLGPCGGCKTDTGAVGYWIYVNGQEQTCIACA